MNVDDFVYQISHLGQHRTAALAATGWEWIEFSSWGREVNIINKDHVNEWPAVQQGYVNHEDAIKIFNRHLSYDLYLTHKNFIEKL